MIAFSILLKDMIMNNKAHVWNVMGKCDGGHNLMVGVVLLLPYTDSKLSVGSLTILFQW